MSKNTLNSESQIYSIPSTPLNEKRNKNDLHFTRSQCLGGNFCSAECVYHKKKRKLKINLNSNNKSDLNINENLISESQTLINQKFKLQKNSMINKNRNLKFGYNHLSDDEGICDEEIEEISIFRKIKNFIVLNNIDNTSLLNNNNNNQFPNERLLSSFLFSSFFNKKYLKLLNLKFFIMIPIILALIPVFIWCFNFLKQNSNLLFDRKISSPLNFTKSKLNSKYLFKKNDLIFREISQLKSLVSSLSFELNELKKYRENIINCNKYCKDIFEENKNKLIEFKKIKQQNSQNKSANLKHNSVTLEDVNNLIKKELAKYDADKTGLPDFALEFSGGEIVNIRCSETYDLYGINYKLFGMSVWKTSNSPRSVIQPNMQPGECWAFKGSQGYLVIKLSQEIIPEQFSYEHISIQISRDGNIDSALKDFEVRSLKDEKEINGWLLGKYTYNDKGEPLQFFKVQDPNPRPTRYIELIVNSNYGHLNYTCLYRFRVHGKRISF